LSLPQSLPLSHQHVTYQPIIISNLSLSTCRCIQPITSTYHCQHVKPITVTDTRPDPVTWIIYQEHISTRCPTSPTHASTKHVPRSPKYNHKICVSTMYQTINMYHTKYQPCNTTCTTTSDSTMHQTMHQPYTNTYTKPSINHAPTPMPNHASTMHHNLYHMPQPSTMYINTIPSTKIVPYHVSTMYINTCTIPCTNKVSQPYTISLNHAIHHIPLDISSKYHKICTLTKYQTTKIIYQVYASTIHLRCASSMCQCLNNIPKTFLK
jgi:hypothetical protein